ncbi:tyrosine-type recombinase/integrase [Leptotrichia alba]|uniref:Tyrosine-type recombinase/integrase n=1 Tax=Leptotrichia alba TaxID=3239304 RepID=A0AB39V8L5_9FUSO
MGLHVFRHSHASILLNEGVNINSSSKRLGYKSVKMTLDTYEHLMDGNEDKLIDTLEKLKNEEC